ncbi:peptidylprolyl isomerase [Kibdelosporangium aridum]|uniref:Peptidyl-prolyl cis-trans isomerase n=1 Tax=Kibdelosporangium aridum TaxID=2030 RepID=A0A428Z8V8_KIBAR|nr:peptidylprolyl isomerase [Kibdelosporangium aridum]RSM84487.1 peptidylprolyl isomerase [Kibdelosporangium aridum]
MEGVADSNESLVGIKVTATLQTTLGDIRIALFPDYAPKTVKSFVGLAEGTKEYSPQNAQGGTSGPYYDGSIFHRIIDGFMIQGGDPTGTGRGGPGFTVPDEFTAELQFNKPYLLAMANINRPNTNGSQFFITVKPTPHLNFKHTIFGEVTDQESRNVVDAISRVKTAGQDRPVEDVVINRVVIERG